MDCMIIGIGWQEDHDLGALTAPPRYTHSWVNQVDRLAMERAHRIGQTKPVKVYRLVCSGSVEERMVSDRREREKERETRVRGHKANVVSVDVC